jgi:hypothetical protein
MLIMICRVTGNGDQSSAVSTLIQNVAASLIHRLYSTDFTHKGNSNGVVDSTRFIKYKYFHHKHFRFSPNEV